MREITGSVTCPPEERERESGTDMLVIDSMRLAVVTYPAGERERERVRYKVCTESSERASTTRS